MARILIVEDNELNRDMLSRRLQRRGHDIQIAVDGNEGLSIARTQLPDIILLDLSLPILDGWELFRRLRYDQDTRTIPVIALTAHALLSDRERALAAGFDDYDTKPVELPRLLLKIDRLLGPQVPA